MQELNNIEDRFNKLSLSEIELELFKELEEDVKIEVDKLNRKYQRYIKTLILTPTHLISFKGFGMFLESENKLSIYPIAIGYSYSLDDDYGFKLEQIKEFIFLIDHLPQHEYNKISQMWNTNNPVKDNRVKYKKY